MTSGASDLLSLSFLLLAIIVLLYHAINSPHQGTMRYTRVMDRLRVLLIFGGESSEHEVSINSATNVLAALDMTRYDVRLCYIDRAGQWRLVETIEARNQPSPHLTPQLGQRSLLIDGVDPLPIDLIIPVLHGKNGEDGSVQGLAQLLHIPYVGPSLLSAAVTMDKDMTKRLALGAHVPVVPWRTLANDAPRPTFAEIASELGAPVFIKPSRAGSSVGVNKVHSAEAFTTALDEAFRHDNTILIEQAITAREIELAVLGRGTSARVSMPGEILPGEEFYSYDDKYSAASTSRVVIPADVDASVATKLQRLALAAYHATGGRGMARVDFFLDPTGQIFLNEINSIPGFTNISMYPKLWEASGLSPQALVDELIKEALASHSIGSV
jgi:D-ala D-ala ligase N-terminal domain protein